MKRGSPYAQVSFVVEILPPPPPQSPAPLGPHIYSQHTVFEIRNHKTSQTELSRDCETSHGSWIAKISNLKYRSLIL